MDKYCVSFDIAKKLKKFGWNSKTNFYWLQGKFNDAGVFNSNHKELLHTNKKMIQDVDCDKKINLFNYYYAPMAEELLEKLPDDVKSKECSLDVFDLTIEKYKGEYYIKYITQDSSSYELQNLDLKCGKCDSKLSDALALMLIWLKENKYL